MTPEAVDAVVIGAGVVGLAVARRLARQGREVLVLEQTLCIGSGASSRNSEVIHAGLYYAPGSLKAQLCVRGRALLYAYCDAHQIAHQRCGKLVVATQADQVHKLQALHAQAQACGVDDVQLLDAEQAHTLEPALHCVAALHSPSTGIVDSHGLMLSLQGELEALGGCVALMSPLLRAHCLGAQGLHLIAGDGTELRARSVVNAAGLWAPDLARHFEGLDPALVPKAWYAKGNYFSLQGRAPFRHLIYPVPQAAGLGVHLTLDLGGQAKFGPDVQWVDGPDAPGALQVDVSRQAVFEAEVRHYWPGLPAQALQPGYAGIRPKIQAPTEGARDFLIQGPQDHGVCGLVNLFGIESPGLTACLAIADHVADVLREA